MKKFTAIVILLIMTALHGSPQTRPRARELGITVGILPTGTLNAITDVDGVLVGHTTIVRGDNIRTGVTAILPHGGNLFREKVPGAVFVGNGFGKLAGSTQVNELGEIETPILLTSTLSVPRVADFLLDFGFKGGIGTSSRKLPQKLGGYTVGVLVQSNFGGVLTINGAPIGQELGRYYLKDELAAPPATPDGSVIIVIATDAPVDARNLSRLAARAMMGLARTGAAASNGSGDYAIAFSTAADVRLKPLSQSERNGPRSQKTLTNDAMSPLFLAVIEATEEAIYNSLFRATTTTGRGHTVEALPLDRTVEILRRHGLISPVR
jgi:D-aminopeptidase